MTTLNLAPHVATASCAARGAGLGGCLADRAPHDLADPATVASIWRDYAKWSLPAPPLRRSASKSGVGACALTSLGENTAR